MNPYDAFQSLFGVFPMPAYCQDITNQVYVPLGTHGELARQIVNEGIWKWIQSLKKEVKEE